MKKVKITAVRRTCYPDLIEQYENPMENACEVEIGTVWVSENAQKPEGFCNAAWGCMESFVKSLAEGGGRFYGDWMKDPHTAMLSCNDGFRPVSYYLEALEDES